MAFDCSSSRAILRSFAVQKVRARVSSQKGLEFLELAERDGGPKVDGAMVSTLRDLFRSASTEALEWEVLALGFQCLSEEFRLFLPLFVSCSSSDDKEASLDKVSGVGIIASIILGLLQHEEPRLRNLVCDKLSSLSILVKMGAGAEAEVTFVNALIEPLLDDIEIKGLTRLQTTRPTTLGSEANIPLDDTTGWGNLETHVRALHSIWKGCSRRVVWACVRPRSRHSSRISSIVLKTLSDNPNRYVREECLNLISTLCDTLQMPPSPADLEACASEGEEETDDSEDEQEVVAGANEPPANAGVTGGTVRTIGMGVVNLRRVSEHSTTEAYDQGSSSAVVSNDDDMFSFGSSLPSSSSSSPSSSLSIRGESGTAPDTSVKAKKTSAKMRGPPLPLLTPSLQVCPYMSAAIEKGLQDEWSQIRLAATGAAKAFLGALSAGRRYERSGAGAGAGDSTGGSVAMVPLIAPDILPPAVRPPPTSNPASTSESSSGVHDWAALLKAIYARHNPEKLQQVPEILQQFRGRERFMLKKLRDKYPGIASNPDVEAALALGGHGIMTSASAGQGGAGPAFPSQPQAPVPPMDLSKNSSATAASMFRGMLGGAAPGSAASAEPSPLQQDTPSQFLAAYPELLPRLCMNRFYAAEGVRQAAHQAWRVVMGAKGGASLLAGNIELVASYYRDQTKSNSHMVSEAALHAMKELGTRLPRSHVLKVLPVLIETMVACAQDHSWPVRDAAVGALGSLTVTFASEISDMEAAGTFALPQVEDDGGRGREGVVEVLLRVCRTQLKDTIASVRDTAAVALADMCAVRGCDEYRDKAREAVVSHLQEHLLGADVKQEASEQNVPSFLPPSMIEAAIAAKSAAGPQAHERAKPDTSKWRRGGGWGCCLDCVEIREGTPQDALEGCLSLLDELAPGKVVLEASEALCKLVAGKYPAHLVLFEQKM